MTPWLCACNPFSRRCSCSGSSMQCLAEISATTSSQILPTLSPQMKFSRGSKALRGWSIFQLCVSRCLSGEEGLVTLFALQLGSPGARMIAGMARKSRRESVSDDKVERKIIGTTRATESHHPLLEASYIRLKGEAGAKARRGSAR